MGRIEELAQESILHARMKGERVITITRLILMIPLFLFAAFILVNRSAQVGFASAITEPPYLVESIGFVTGGLYSVWILRQLKKKKYHNWIKYVSPFIDVTLLNSIMYVNAAYPRNALVITGAVTFIYFIFLAMSAFRNSPSSVIFTGAYIAVSYVALTVNALSAIKFFQPDGNTFTNAYSEIVKLDGDDEIIKPVIILIITFLLAYLARRFNGMVTDQIEMSVEREKLKEVFVDNVKQVSGSLLSSGKALSNTYRNFSAGINQLVLSSVKIGDQTKEEYSVIESTSKTVSEMIGSIEAVTGSIKEQTYHVGETAAAIAEMESSIRTITEISKKASAVALSLFSAAKEGGGAVSEVYNAITETEKSSRQIEEIVGLITSIASTTDLLSMNAAIEAAHAGDAGRGFAVVADEIRRLAETSGTNAKQIGEILKDILVRIQNITALAQQANAKLQSILGDADQTKEINSSIQNAMEEELKTVNEILKSLTSLENITNAVKDSSVRQSEGSMGLLASMTQLKTQADTVSSLIKSQVSECESINSLTDTFNSVVKDNDAVIDRLEGLVEKL